MYTTYHLDSAQEITIDLLDSIKATFKTKAISITVVEEEKLNFELSDEQKAILDEGMAEDKSDYITGDQFLKRIRYKYGI